MRIQHLIAAGAFVAAAATPASAQIGGLIRKAKDAAVNKAVEDKVAGGGNKNLRSSESFGPELTQASLDGVIRGLAASVAKLEEADRIREERQRVDAAAAKSYTAHEKERQAYDALLRKIEPCQDSVISTRRKTAQETYMQKMQTNPAAQAQAMQEAMALGQKMALLQSKGDTAEIRRLTMNVAKAQGFDPKADSAAAVKSCGSIPTQPAFIAEQDEMRKQSSRLDNQIRDLENGAQSAGAAASGLSAKEYGLARERVLHWSMEAHGASPIQGFGADERKLLEARRSDIDKYRKALN